VLRTTEMRHRWNLVNLLHHMLSGTVHLHLLHAAYLGAMRRSHPRWFVQVVWEALAVALLLGGVAVLVSPRASLTLVLLPSVLGQLLIVGFGYVQHDGTDPASEHDHSRNFTSPIFNWFILDNGFHTVHHDQPHAHWRRGSRRPRAGPRAHAPGAERALAAALPVAHVRAPRRAAALRRRARAPRHGAAGARAVDPGERAVATGAIDTAAAPRAVGVL